MPKCLDTLLTGFKAIGFTWVFGGFVSQGVERVKADTCAYCKEKGHWKRECPWLREKGEEHPKAHQMRIELSGEESS